MTEHCVYLTWPDNEKGAEPASFQYLTDSWGWRKQL